MKNEFLKSLLYFTKRDRNAILVLLLLIVCTILLPKLFPKQAIKPVVDLGLQKQIDSVVAYQSNAGKTQGVAYTKTYSTEQSGAVKLQPFPFDPNTLPEDGWLKMGLHPRTVQILMNYRNKGGRFRKPEDLRKIYSLRPQEADVLVPFVRIAGNTADGQYKSEKHYEQLPSGKKVYPVIDINTATEEEWKALPGIGDVLSKRIVKFRNSMGGFSSIEDVKRTYGISDSTFEMIRPYLRFKRSDQ